MLCYLHWFSQVIQKQVTTTVIFPDQGSPPFATFYLLHGLSDDHTIWIRRTRIEMYAAQYPLIVVMPDGFRGFYTNNDAGPAYARYIGEELPAMIERTMAARADRAGRCIGGLSMGGYGALRVGLAYSTRFASINSHSGALMAGSRELAPNRFPEAPHIFGQRPRGSDHDLLTLAARAKADGTLPPLRIDCGLDDFLLPDNRGFHEELQKLNIQHEYEEFEGDHNWDYWDLHIREALAFHARNLELDGNSPKPAGA